MIDSTLTHARSSRYKHAARHLKACSRLASALEQFGAFEAHDAYEARLRREHGRKRSFWDQNPLGDPPGARTDTLVFRWLREPCSHLTAALFSNKTEPPPWPSGVNLQLKCPQL